MILVLNTRKDRKTWSVGLRHSGEWQVECHPLHPLPQHSLCNNWKKTYDMKNAVFWNVTPCGSCRNRCSSKTLVLTRATWHNIPEDGVLHSPPP
jgi:hypothetical protein